MLLLLMSYDSYGQSKVLFEQLIQSQPVEDFIFSFFLSFFF